MRPTARFLPPLVEERLRSISILAVAASAFAAAELVLGISLGGFFAWGRAEALLFLEFRPWLLLAAAMLAQRFDWIRRYTLYVIALLLAGTSESLFLIGLGAHNPWPEALRGCAAGAFVVFFMDAALVLGARLRAGWGLAGAAGLLLILLTLPNALKPYEAIAWQGKEAATGPKIDLMLMSALPLRWGEKGPLVGSSRPAEAYFALAEEFRIRPLDVLDTASLKSGKLLLVAQPRALSPGELVALDAWVRRGGRALILTDPQLVWPSELALGDIRRAPAVGLLDPLLRHWGLRMSAPARPQWMTRDITLRGAKRRLITFADGSFVPTASDCAVVQVPQIARCAIGEGRAILFADADMLHDQLWVGRGSGGTERHGRISDNPVILADLLDELAGIDRSRIARPVQWLDGEKRGLAWLLALLPILAAAAPAAIPSLRRRA